jgi:hypothetical protein
LSEQLSQLTAGAHCPALQLSVLSQLPQLSPHTVPQLALLLAQLSVHASGATHSPAALHAAPFAQAQPLSQRVPSQRAP